MRHEKVQIILDAWKKVFSLRTLGGGYIRHFLLFTNHGVAIVETSHVDNVPPWRQETIHETFGEGDPLSHLFWGPILSTLYEYLFKHQRRRDEEVLRGLRLGEPTLEEALEALQELRKRMGIWSIKFKEYLPYDLVKLLEIGSSNLRLIKVGGKKEDYAVYLPGTRFQEFVERVKALVGESKVRVRQ